MNAADGTGTGRSARRELVRRYKEAPPPMGVYAIRNRADGRVFLDASLNLQGAMNRARFELNRGQHRHAGLQQDWTRQHGAQFSLDVVDTLKKREDDAGGDYRAELAALLTLWQQELFGGDARAYNPPASKEAA